jgi:hypothetical protein
MRNPSLILETANMIFLLIKVARLAERPKQRGKTADALAQHSLPSTTKNKNAWSFTTFFNRHLWRAA